MRALETIWALCYRELLRFVRGAPPVHLEQADAIREDGNGTIGRDRDEHDLGNVVGIADCGGVTRA